MLVLRILWYEKSLLRTVVEEGIRRKWDSMPKRRACMWPSGGPRVLWWPSSNRCRQREDRTEGLPLESESRSISYQCETTCLVYVNRIRWSIQVVSSVGESSCFCACFVCVGSDRKGVRGSRLVPCKPLPSLCINLSCVISVWWLTPLVIKLLHASCGSSLLIFCDGTIYIYTWYIKCDIVSQRDAIILKPCHQKINPDG